ncbi:SDR family NAD(P)-dependent oxidoreductase [Paractinoplanes atraurantiacus]|uniref:Acyl-CoA synthetase (AMP-forming)/AMP-acid ligase II n=1 Tax=Paractinoplanes atraurantiacus TaxID=1036182 RepID=A0A285GLQ8_9ACTN|nr:SDR family NAD(P)-dependent oxidoreductase [Actinoplanes atraurantiacus]SNY24502.1 Acyl-CoA synthetase (AMP-forming)/AMP-acid ligase II [Actinoplanes atraurantiacus]
MTTTARKSLQSAILAELTDGARAVPGVADVAVLLRTDAARSVPSADARPPVDEPPAVAGDRPPAVLLGGPLTFDPGDPATLGDSLRSAAATAPGKGFVYLAADDTEDRQTYPRLLADAGRVLAGLRAAGVRAGDTLILQIERPRPFMTALFACVLGGFVPTPIGTSARYTEENAATRRVRGVWENLGRPLVLADDEVEARLAAARLDWGDGDLRVATVDRLGAGREPDTDWHPARPGDVALHLLTSGSTGVPKCIQLRHRELMAAQRASAQANGLDGDDVTLNWMPLDHAGGLVMFVLRSVFLRCDHVQAPAEAFLAAPLRWLDWAHRYRATITWSANFAFNLVVERAAEAAGREWDLSRLKHVASAGEAVVPQTAHRFLRLLAPYGLAATALRPCFGMSEACTGITFGRLDAGDPAYGTVTVDKRFLHDDVRPVPSSDPEALTLAGLGGPMPGVDIRIADRDDRVVAQGRIGRLQLRGATIMAGYRADAAADAAAFTDDGWFTTGDLGFIWAGHLVLTGREKDIIIVRGANYLNHDIETIVESVPGTSPTWVAACGDADPASGTDRVVIFFVPESDDPAEQARTARDIRTTLARDLGLWPDPVVPVPQDAFPRTRSGKIQRARLLEALHAGDFDVALYEMTSATAPAPTVPPKFFTRVWVRDAAAPVTEPPAGPWLAFVPGDELAARVAAAATGPLTTVRPGDRFARTGPGAFTIRPGVPDDYARLLAEAYPGEPGPAMVVHAWCAGAPAADFGEALALAAPSVRALLAVLPEDSTGQVLVLTRGALWTGPGDTVSPAVATLPGLVRSAAAEAYAPAVRLVDLAEVTAGAVRREAGTAGGEPVVAVRGDRRLVAQLRGVPSDELVGAPRLRAGGLYLVTGGLGGIGTELCRYLLAAYQARLLVVGRTPADEVAERVADLAELGEVAYVPADVADREALAAAVRGAEHRWDTTLAGVLHLAGERPGAGLTVWRESADGLAHTYRAKVHGTRALAAILEDRPDAPLVLFSSVDGALGGPVADSSAAAFLDGFADHWGRERGRPVHCLAWAPWGANGIAAEHGLAAFLAALAGDQTSLLIGLERTETATADPDRFEVVLAYAAPGPIEEEDLRATVADGLDGVTLSVVRVPAIPYDEHGDPDERRLWSVVTAATQARHRPYEHPRTDLERALAAVWAEVLGQPVVGRGDDFFELGGTSMHAAQLIERTNAQFSARLGTHHLYEYPTVGRLADVLKQEGSTC